MNETKDIPEIRFDKTKIKVGSASDNSDEIEYWRNTSTKDRLQHLERLRRIVYGDKIRGRISRVVEVVEL
jgi:hypothetical protein